MSSKKIADIAGSKTTPPWLYSKTVKDHFINPRNFVKGKPPQNFSGLGMVGSAACGDMMKMWIWVDPKGEKIKKCRWQTFGCGSAIASTSILSEMVREMKIDKALKIKPQDIVKKLGGLPSRKFHCSVLGDKALRGAINDYFRRSGQKEKIIEEGAKIIDPQAGVTDKDIEQAVLDGAATLEQVQEKIKAGVNNPSVLPEIKQLIRFYRDKYYG